MAVNWDEVREEVTGHLQALLRLDTVNPPGNETHAAEYLAGVARREGLEPVVVESQPGRGNFVARLRDSGVGRPVLLMGHTDVVSVEPERWTHGPFSGDLADGHVWGRGAVDMKGQVAAELTALLLLKRQGVPLGRDVIMAAFADEEAGSTWGAKWMWENRRDLIDAEYALNEGGGAALDLGGRRFYLCQVGEKGGARMRIVARAQPGHASVPRDDTAMYRLGKALVRLHEFEPPTILTRPVEQMLRTMAAALDGDARQAVEAALADPSAATLARLPLDEITRLQLRATTRNTAVPTIVGGGHRINVIPSEVWVDVDGRVLPGQDPAEWARQVQQAVGDEVEVQPRGGSTGLQADPESPFFDAIAAVMGEQDRGALVAPFLVSGGTDAKALPGIKVYGFMPSRNGAEESGLAHAHDERVRVDSLLFGTRCLYEIVRRFCAA